MKRSLRWAVHARTAIGVAGFLLISYAAFFWRPLFKGGYQGGFWTLAVFGYIVLTNKLSRHRTLPFRLLIVALATILMAFIVILIHKAIEQRALPVEKEEYPDFSQLVY